MVNVLKLPAQPRVDCWIGYEGTNIIEDEAVKEVLVIPNDALIDSYTGRNSRAIELRLERLN